MSNIITSFRYFQYISVVCLYDSYIHNLTIKYTTKKIEVVQIIASKFPRMYKYKSKYSHSTKGIKALEM